MSEAMSRLGKLEQRLRDESRSSLEADGASRVQGGKIARTHPADYNPHSADSTTISVCSSSWLGGQAQVGVSALSRQLKMENSSNVRPCADNAGAYMRRAVNAHVE